MKGSVKYVIMFWLEMPAKTCTCTMLFLFCIIKSLRSCWLSSQILLEYKSSKFVVVIDFLLYWHKRCFLPFLWSEGRKKIIAHFLVHWWLHLSQKSEDPYLSFGKYSLNGSAVGIGVIAFFSH